MKNLNLRVLTFLLAMAFSVQLSAQSHSFDQFPHKPSKAYYWSYWTALKRTATGPAHWKKQEWMTFGGVVAGGTVLYIFDDNIRNYVQSHRSAGLTKLSKYGLEPWGSGVYTFPVVAGFYFYGLATNNIKARRVAMAATEAVVIGGISVEVVKHIFGRRRPYQNNPPDPRKWDGPMGFQYLSFPSGHTTVAFSVATVFASAYKDKPWVGIISYGIAAGVGLSRVYDDKHWSSDVLMGAALGFAVGKTIYHIMDRNKNLTVGVSNEGGLALAYHF